MAAIVQAVASGNLTPSEAAELSRLVEAYVRSLEATDFDRQELNHADPADEQ
jgi:hypothetical protein